MNKIILCSPEARIIYFYSSRSINSVLNLHSFDTVIQQAYSRIAQELLINLHYFCRDDLDAEEYEDTKNDTIEQLKEFKESLDKMMGGDLSLVDELNSMQLVNNLLVG